MSIDIFIITVYTNSKKTDCFLGEMPDKFEVKVKETAHFLYWGTINYHRIAYFIRTLSKREYYYKKRLLFVDAFYFGESMLTKEDLLTQKSIPHINDISLRLYKEFCTDTLFKQRFHYYFTDGTDIIVEFREWGIYHMLSIQHIDYNIPKNNFLQKIDSGLSFSDFQINNSINQRFKKEKQRITMFSCIYNALKRGKIFYIPDKSVPNTNNVKCDYIVYKIISNKGMNIGMRYEDGCFIPLTILISKSSNLVKYVDKTIPKKVDHLKIIDIATNKIIEEVY